MAHSFKPFKVVHCDAMVAPPPALVQEAITKTKLVSALQKQPSMLSEIWELIKDDLLLLGCIILTAVGAAIIQLQTPLVTGQLINILSSSAKSLSINSLNAPAMKLFGLLTAQGLLTFLHIALVSAFGENVAKRLRAKLFKAIVQQDISFFDCHKSGELVSRLTADVSDFKVNKREQLKGTLDD
jgi:ATP-binding cassette subfamily B (MDR/TAP) protein 8